MRTVTVGILLLLMPSPCLAWSLNAHRFITEQMIALLPTELKPLFERHKAFVIERSVDPDMWRIVGWEAEPPHHFVDLDYFGKYPFAELPHEYDRAVQKYGRQVIHEQGLLPWRTQEFFGRLQREFESLKRPNAPGYAIENVALFSAILSHYIGDGHVPLHSVVNYDGQRSNQHANHNRWEGELFERNRTRLKVAPAAPRGVKDAREFMFSVLLASNKLAEGVLAADKKAVAGRQFYDDAYFDAFAKEQLSVLQQRLNESITAIASAIIGAWEQAGRPAIVLDQPRKPRPVSRPPG